MLAKSHAPAETIELLRGVPLFVDMGDKELQEIARLTRSMEWPEGAIICAEGASGIGLHVIANGTVRVSSTHGTDGTLGRGAYFGEIALIDGGPRMATVVAVTPVTTLAIVAWEFKGIIEEHPTVAMRLIKELCGRIRTQAGTFTG
jgi:CRP-like cAMP-binding protein